MDEMGDVADRLEKVGNRLVNNFSTLWTQVQEAAKHKPAKTANAEMADAFLKFADKLEQVKTSIYDAFSPKTGQPAGAAAAGSPGGALAAAAASSGKNGVIDVRIVNDPLSVVVKERQKGFLESVGGFFKDVVGGIGAGVGNLVGGVVGGLAGGIAGGIMNPKAMVDSFRELHGLVGAIIQALPQFMALKAPVAELLNLVIDAIKRVQGIIDSVMGYVFWIVKGFASDGWISTVVFSFLDSVILWAVDRVTKLLGWIAGVLKTLNTWLTDVIGTVVENAVNAAITGIFDTLAARVANFMNAIVIAMGGVIGAVKAGFVAIFDWLKQWIARLAWDFMDANIKAFNSILGAFGIKPIAALPGTAPPAPGPLNLIDKVKEGWKDSRDALKSVFPTDFTKDTIRNSQYGDFLGGPAPAKKEVPDFPKKAIPKFELGALPKPAGAPTMADIEKQAPSVNVGGGIHVTVVAKGVQSDNLDELARQLGERLLVEMERVGGLRQSRLGRPTIVTP